MAKKISDEECTANYERLVQLFREAVPGADRFSVVAGYGMDVGMTNFIVVRQTTYTYSNYAVGYDERENEIVILPVDRDLSAYGNAFSLNRDTVIKAKQSWLSKEITIRDNSLPKKYIQFSVPEWINDDEDEVVIAVKQVEQAKDFIEFFKTRFTK
ncbi:hypothetical protein [Breznakiella homolactica]|uniref:Uncharacterized protein n=1 Tax=Breznakiella homolactica TaxID=2798577 RepID=A0A7T7XPC8_9SPIR|nr:hypothetical protein [Breznakiella homolactica]QQO09913.1 hypothetical protein JFL75_03100 [Breznakiella homolactica]